MGSQLPPVLDFPPGPLMSMEPTQSQLLENLPFENQDADLFSFLDNLGQNVPPAADAGYRGQGGQAARAAKADVLAELPSWEMGAMDGAMGLAAKVDPSSMNGFASTSGYSEPVAMPSHVGAQQQMLSGFPGSADTAQVLCQLLTSMVAIQAHKCARCSHACPVSGHKHISCS